MSRRGFFVGECCVTSQKNVAEQTNYLVFVNGTVHPSPNFAIIIHHLKHSQFLDQSCQIWSVDWTY